jgi:hypothetical protein
MRRYAAVLTIFLAACSASVTTTGSSRTASGPSSSPAGTIGENGISFHYPTNWQRISGLGQSASTANRPLFEISVGIDDHDVVQLSSYQLQATVTDANIDAALGEFSSLFRRLATQAGGTVVTPFTVEHATGLPGITGVITAKNPQGIDVESVIHVVFNGTSEYLLNCQYTADTKAEILTGCDQIVSTFQVTG